MRLGLYHGPLYRGKSGYETYGPFAGYVAEFARHCEHVVVFAPVTTRDTGYRGVRITAPNVRVAELPDFCTHVQATRHLPSIYRTFRREIDDLDVINCRNTAPYGYLLYYLGRPRGIGFFYDFTSEPRELIRSGPRYSGWYGWFARAAYGVDFWIQKRIMRRTFSFVRGKGPCDRLRHVTDRLYPLISTTLEREDLHERTDHALHKPVRLLYVGYLKHMKGLLDVIDALALLRDEGEDVELHLVGAGPEEEALRTRAARCSLTDRVHFHGYVVMGPDLNQHYHQADVFVFASVSEGSPRVVLEAMAHSLPVVSTPVGSVPELLANGERGLLVPCSDPRAVARAVSRLIHDDAMRVRYAKAGHAFAKYITVDRLVAPMVAKARELARGPRSTQS
jgi:glycosyltransferase involved in cell wall biosynthesis